MIRIAVASTGADTPSKKISAAMSEGVPRIVIFWAIASDPAPIEAWPNASDNAPFTDHISAPILAANLPEVPTPSPKAKASITPLRLATV